MSMAWIAVGTAVLGAGASIYGANQQAKANKSAQQANQNSQDKINDSAWTNWLMTRGVAPTSSITAGEMPSSYAPVNTRLPLWASVNMASGPSRWQRVGSSYAKPNTLAVSAPIGNSTATDPVGTVTSATPEKGNKTANAALNVLDPTGTTAMLAGTGGPRTAGTVAKNLIDPLGLFCWVARAAYGEENPKWMRFREWLLKRATHELRAAYWLNGPSLASRMRNSPALRDEVRGIMDGILSTSC